MRVLGQHVATCQSITPTSTLQTSNLVSSNPDVSLIKIHVFKNIKYKEQLMDNIQSCLGAMETAR